MVTKINYKQYSVHRLVYQGFYPNINMEGFEVNHINNIHTDNCIDNFELCTHSENMLHAVNFRKSFEGYTRPIIQ